MKPRKKITQEKLDKLEQPTLEDIMAFVNGGQYDKFFLLNPKEYDDGCKEYLTKKGGEVYGKLITILYACARLADKDVEDIVEELDDIVIMG